jgi:hypothetical protein
VLYRLRCSGCEIERGHLREVCAANDIDASFRGYDLQGHRNE